MKTFLKKRWSDILLGVFLLFMLLPQTRQPIQIFIQRLISTSPKVLKEENQQTLENYQLQLENANGEIVNLSDYKGEVVILNFWATWCPPCIAEMPDFSSLYTDYNDKVHFFFITQDDWGKINAFEEKRKFNLPYYKLIKPNNSIDYTTLPTTYLINKNAKIIIKKVGVADWNAASFRKNLDELISQ